MPSHVHAPRLDLGRHSDVPTSRGALPRAQLPPIQPLRPEWPRHRVGRPRHRVLLDAGRRRKEAQQQVMRAAAPACMPAKHALHLVMTIISNVRRTSSYQNASMHGVAGLVSLLLLIGGMTCAAASGQHASQLYTRQDVAHTAAADRPFCKLASHAVHAS